MENDEDLGRLSLILLGKLLFGIFAGQFGTLSRIIDKCFAEYILHKYKLTKNIGERFKKLSISFALL